MQSCEPTDQNHEKSTNLQNGEIGARLNFDVSSYKFSDLDLEIAVRRLPIRDQEVLILHLMGHNQSDIARLHGVTRSMISKRLSKIMKTLSRRMKKSSII